MMSKQNEIGIAIRATAYVKGYLIVEADILKRTIDLRFEINYKYQK